VETDDITAVDDPTEHLNLSKSALHERPHADRLPGQESAKRWRFPKDAIDGWLRIAPESNRAGKTKWAT